MESGGRRQERKKGILNKKGTDMEEKLMQWIRENAETEFGKEHQFCKIQSLADYQNYVPLSDYSDYADAVQRMYEGKTNILTAYPLYCFVMTSGCEGKPKRIPLTAKGLEPFAWAYGKMMRHVEGMAGKHLHLSVFPSLESEQGSVIMVSTAAYRFLYEQEKIHLDQYVGGKDLLFNGETEDQFYIKLWVALQEEDLVTIQSIYLYDVLLFFGYLEEHGMEILSAMEAGVIPPKINLSKKMKIRLLTEFRPSMQRIQFLKEEFCQGFQAIAPRIWKRLYMISGIGGGFFRYREDILRRYTGKVLWQYFMYGSSECLAGYAEGLETPSYTLLPDNGYYEFLDQDTGIVYSMGEGSINRIYELILTNRSGFYRYRSGDLVKIERIQDGLPVLEIIGRSQQVLNVAGEKINAVMLEAAVLRFAEKQGMIFHDYAVAVEESRLPMGYLVYLEPERGPVRESVQEMSRTFDQILREINMDYDDLRKRNKLSKPRICCLRRGELEHRRKYRNTAQNKPGQTVYWNI